MPRVGEAGAVASTRAYMEAQRKLDSSCEALPNAHPKRQLPTHPPSSLPSAIPHLPCRNGFAADSPEPRTGPTQPRRLDEVDRAAEKDLCYAG